MAELCAASSKGHEKEAPCSAGPRLSVTPADTCRYNHSGNAGEWRVVEKTLLLGHQSDGDDDRLRRKTALGAASSKEALPKCPPVFVFFFKQMEVLVVLFVCLFS